MEKIIKAIKIHRNINAMTLKNYVRILERFYKAINSSSDQSFLDSNPTILELIKKYKISTQTTLLSSMIVALESFQNEYKVDYQASLDIYRKYMKELMIQLEDEKYKCKKNPTQEKNWTTWNLLQNCIKVNRKSITKLIKRNDLGNHELKLVQLWLISNLYCLSDELPPRRLDYKDIKIISKKDFEKDHMPDQNYLIVKSSNIKYLYFANFKTVKHHGIISIQVGEKLNRLLNEYLKCLKNNNTEHDYLLFNNKGEAVGSQLAPYIGEAFQATGKDITVNLIRHIYLSQNADNWNLEKRRDISRLMSHNIEMQLCYNKNDSDSDSQ